MSTSVTSAGDRRARGVLLAAVVATFLLALSSMPSAAAGPQDGGDSCALAIWNSREGRPVLGATAMVPGLEATGRTAVRNEADRSAVVTFAARDRVDRPGPHGGSLSRRLAARVVEHRRGQRRHPVYEGSLAALNRVRLDRFAPGEKRRYSFRVQFEEGGDPPSPVAGDNAYQGSSVRVDLVWTASPAQATAGSSCDGRGVDEPGGAPGTTTVPTGELPFTGLVVAAIAAAGLALLVAGRVLRRRTQA